MVRGKKRARENLERYCLAPYDMKILDTGNYSLTIPYQSDEDLDKTVYSLLDEISQEADIRHCHIDVDIWEQGTERNMVGLKYIFCSVSPQTL